MSTGFRPRAGLWLALGAALLCLSCTDVAQSRMARRILEDHRTRARVKPLAAAQVIRIRLTSRTGDASGSATIEWDEENYRETMVTGGLTTVRGIQGGKGYFTDEDGVTRVASEPMLAQLVTRFYWWKRGYLFDDQQGARLTLGPADDSTVSVGTTPRGGNRILLTFSRRDLALLSAKSNRFDLEFSGPTRFRDLSRRQQPVSGEILWIGLPTGPLRDRVVGGWLARWPVPSVEVPFERAGRALTIPARISGQPVTLALDAAQDGPIQVRSAVAGRLGLAFVGDVFGRTVARGAELAIGTLSYPAISIEKNDALAPGIDAEAGSALFRETVVEIDPAQGRARFHDPSRWVSREGFFRVLLDDDGDRAAAIVRRKGVNLRLLGPTAIGGPIALTPETRARLGLPGQGEIAGLQWGVDLPPLPILPSDGSESDFGEDGRLGWDLVLRFHAFFDMPHRWAYVKPSK